MNESSGCTFETCGFVPYSAPWDSDRLLAAALSRYPLGRYAGAPPESLLRYQDALWTNIVTEFDARFFHQFLQQSGVALTPEFRAFQAIWQRDEWNHTQGFARLFAAFYGISTEETFRKLEARSATSDFAPIAHLLRDEFTILAILAFDELNTTRIYLEDRNEVFCHFGDDGLYQWIGNVVRDEVYHFMNCLRLIKLRHWRRVAELPALFRELTEQAQKGIPYSATFVLDQSTYLDSPAAAQEVIEIIQRHFKARRSKR